MKPLFRTFMLIALFAFMSPGAFSQTNENAKQSAVTCSCQPGYTTCNASSRLMSCCVCCQPGSSCGSWTFLGFCGCACENTSVSTRYLYIDEFRLFLKFLDDNKIYMPDINVKFEELIKGLEVVDGKDARYVIPEPDKMDEFSNYYKLEAGNLSEAAQKIIKEYIEKDDSL